MDIICLKKQVPIDSFSAFPIMVVSGVRQIGVSAFLANTLC